MPGKSRRPSREGAGQDARPPSSTATGQPTSTEWPHGAACAGEETDLFFPIGSSGPALRQTEQAKSICRPCPVRLDCLNFALRAEETVGVWGGTDEYERHDLHKRMRGE